MTVAAPQSSAGTSGALPSTKRPISLHILNRPFSFISLLVKVLQVPRKDGGGGGGGGHLAGGGGGVGEGSTVEGSISGSTDLFGGPLNVSIHSSSSNSNINYSSEGGRRDSNGPTSPSSSERPIEHGNDFILLFVFLFYNSTRSITLPAWFERQEEEEKERIVTR